MEQDGGLSAWSQPLTGVGTTPELGWRASSRGRARSDYTRTPYVLLLDEAFSYTASRVFSP